MITITQDEAKRIATKPERYAAMRDVCPEPIAAAGGEITLRHMPGKGYALEGRTERVRAFLASVRGADALSQSMRQMREA